MRKDFLARLFSVISGFSLLANSIVYPFAIAYAQSAEPTATPDAQATIQPTDSPTAEPTLTSAPDATFAPVVTPTPVEETLDPTPTPTETLVIETTVSEGSQATAPPTENPVQTAQESATPESTPAVEEKGEISATILPNTQASSVEEPDLSFETESSAAIVTDKGDYAPTDTVLITGTGFIAGKTYDLLITGSWDFSFSDKITADENGNLFYSYQLKTFRPNYLVEVSFAGINVASVSFTDAIVFTCSNDQQGVDDYPGQKDLNQMCIDESTPLTNWNISWNWDDSDWSGGNTGDACGLFDTDGDGKANYAYCLQVSGDPAVEVGTFLYQCNDSKADRCAGKSEITQTDYCSVSLQTDAFAATVPSHSTFSDTQGLCSIPNSLMGSIATTVMLDVCSYPSEEPNSDPSDCIFIATQPKTGKIEMIKDLIPSLDLGKFSFVINSNVQASNIGDGGTTGEVVTIEGTSIIEERAEAGTSLTDYSTSIICRDRNGAGSIVAQSSNAGPLNVPVANNDDIVCTVTNTRLGGNLIVNKVVTNDNGGTKVIADFPLFVDGNGVTSGQSNSYTPREYTVSETSSVGYTPTFSGDCNSAGKVTVIVGQTKTCTITNDDIAPSLTLSKNLIKDDGGLALASNWTLTAVGPTGISGQGPTVNNGISFDAGTYDLSESGGPFGYAASNWVCTGGTQVDGDTVTVGLGQNVVCTITNDDIAPKLTVVKYVDNSNGGRATASDFSLTVGGNPVTSGVEYEYEANTAYVINEVGAAGYSFESIVGSDKCPTSLGGTITLAPGDDITCTITNEDIAPSITLIKSVIKDNGGTAGVDDFGLSIGAVPVSSGQKLTLDSNTPYIIDEEGLDGYKFSSITGDSKCPVTLGNTITLDPGEDIVCTIVNDDISPSLTVIKNVINDDDGTLSAGDFTMEVNGTNVSDSSFPGDETGTTITLNAGSYGVSETGGTGTYTQLTPSADCSGTIAAGENKICTITNDDNDFLPAISVDKSANVSSVNEPGENVTFTFTVTNQSTSDPVTITSLSDSVYGILAGDADCQVDTILPIGGSCTFEITRFVDGDASDTDHVNTFTAHAEDNEENDVYASEGETVGFDDVLPLVDLNKEVSPSSMAEPGGDFTFTLTITNNSVEEVTITDLTDTNALSAECLALIGTTLAFGASTSCTYTVSHSDAGSYENTAEVTVEDNEDNKASDNDSETVRVSDELPSVSLDKSVDASTMTEPGGDFTFTLTITNNSVESISITDLTDDNILSTECLNLIGTLILSGNSVSCTYVVNHSVIGTYDNTAEVTVYDNEENRATSSDDESVTITQEDKPELTLTKTNDKPNVSEGDTINYTLKVKNTGNIKLGNFEIIDVLPGGFEYITDSSLLDGFVQEPTVNGGILTWTIGEGIAVDQEVVVTYQVKVGTNLDPGIYTNLASCRTVVRKVTDDEIGPFFAAFVLQDQINDDIDCECNGGDPVFSSSSIGGVLAYSGALTPQVLGASTELPATGSSTWYLLLITMVALSGIGLKVAGRKLKNEIN